MTFNNSVLLILKTNGSEEFNELLSRISLRYKNQDTAYSSLSRAIKNLSSLGLVQKNGSRIFITDKGLASIQIEMKEKFILKLNDLIKNPVDNLEEIVQLLIVFTERANESNDLLLNARENASFTISDISDLQEKIEQKKDLLEKMASLIGVQEERLRELNFTDSKKFIFNEKFVKKIILFSGNEKIVVETIDHTLLKKLPNVFRKKNSFIIEQNAKQHFFEILLANNLSKFVIYLNQMRIFVSKGEAKCYSSYNTLKEFKKLFD